VKWDLVEENLVGHLSWDQMPFESLPTGLNSLFGRVFDWHTSFEWPLAEALPTGRIEISGEEIHLTANLDQGGLQASVTLQDLASGEIEAYFDDDDASWSGTGELHIKAVDGLARRLAPKTNPLLTGSIRVPLKIWGKEAQVLGLEGNFEDSSLFLGDKQTEIVGDQGFRWDLGGFRLNGLKIDVGGDQVFIRGGVDDQGHLAGNVSGVFDARLLRIFLPEWEPAGRATGTIEILGDMATPQLEGIAKIERGSFRLPGTRTVVGDVDGALFLSAGEVALEDLSFKFMRGRGRGRGRILVDGGETNIRLNGTIEGLDFPLFPGFVPRIKGQWALEGPVDDLELSGDLIVIRGEVRRQDDLASLLMDWFGKVGPPAEDGLRLDLHIRADENLVSRSPFLRLEAGADLNITGTDARPGLVGSVEFMEGGEFTLQGIRYELERGQISFSDSTRIDPILDFQARASIREYEVWLSLTGTMDRLIPTVSSDPPLNPSEIYSLMALGQVSRGEPGGAVGLTMASTLLTKRINEVLGNREQWMSPVDQIRVDPFVESSTGDPSARVTVVKQLSPSVTVTLQSNLSGNREEIISVRWYLGSGLFVEASRDSRHSDGSYGLDFKMRRRY
jgi:translocation and assembly module TamB